MTETRYEPLFSLDELRDSAVKEEVPAPLYRALWVARPETESRWVAYFPDQEAWGTFVLDLLRAATADLGSEFANGAIDFFNDREDSPFLWGYSLCTEGAWVATDSRTVGSTSRPTHAEDVQVEPCSVKRFYRGFSLISLDTPTVLPERREESFWYRIIHPLAARATEPPWADNLYGWLDVMFSFCGGKPFVYHSRYVPGGEIQALAARHGVQLVHRPLDAISTGQLEANRSFRLVRLTHAQWKALRELWEESETRPEEERI